MSTDILESSDEISAPHDGDAELVKCALNGERQAFAELIGKHYDMIYRVAYRWVGTAADAEDVAQDVCIKLAKVLPQFEGRSLFTTWLCSVVINVARDALRKNNRRPTSDIEDVEAQLVSDDRPDEAVEALELWASVRGLPPRQGDAVLLVYAEGRTHAEAAQILGCSESTVSWHIHAAKKALRSLLDQ